jgi:hypothetical protein
LQRDDACRPLVSGKRAAAGSKQFAFLTPKIVVQQAGFNSDTPWIIVLKIAGELKREVDLCFVIDTRHKGIEKLRLTPRQINEGEMATGQRVELALARARLRCACAPAGSLHNRIARGAPIDGGAAAACAVLSHMRAHMRAHVQGA